MRGAGIVPAGTKAAVVMGGIAWILLVGLAAETAYLWFRPDPTVSAERPVVTDELVHRTAVDAANRDVTEILSTTYEDYDGEVEKARALMTDTFAEEYAQTSADIRPEFIAAKTEVHVQVVGAGVVRADHEQVQVLLFLDQSVSKAGEPQPATPYRALVTMVDTEVGWQVAEIETR